MKKYINKTITDNLKRERGRVNWKESVGKDIKFIYRNIEYNFKIIKYHKGEAAVTIQDQFQEEFKIKISNLSKTNIGKIIGVYGDRFKVEIGEKFKDSKRDITIIDREYKLKEKRDYIRKEKRYKYKCNKCPNIDFINESNLLNGGGCNVCGATSPKPLLGYNTVYDKDKYTTKAIGVELAKKITCGSDKGIYPICPLCGMKKNKKMKIGTISSSQSIGCQYCSDGISTPNKIIRQIIIQLDEQGKIGDYDFEQSPEWNEGYYYDVIVDINNEKVNIEMDGELGHGNKVHSKSNRTIEETKQRDNIKDEAANKNGVRVIRIDCKYKNIIQRFEYIKNNILNSELTDLVDLSSINWDKVNEYSQNSFVKIACSLKNEFPFSTTGDIAKKMKMSISAIYSYLKIGSKLGWCNYNPNYERELTNAKIAQLGRERYSTPILIYEKDTMKFIGEEKSQAELSKVSEAKYGVKIVGSHISKVANGKKDSYKGFIFVFKDNNRSKCDKQLKEIIKEVCYYKSINPDKTTTEIAKKFGLNRTTIIEYLKEGTKLGICNYDGKEETAKRIARMDNERYEKKVMLFKEGKYIGTFKSITELASKSMSIVGVKLNKASISRVINKKQKEHKGFTIVASE